MPGSRIASAPTAPGNPNAVLGTVPVEADGSALFRVPANTPISFQPLDGEGKALQLMRSWTTAMPGETVSCVGCHESQNSGPPNRTTLAAKHKPVGDFALARADAGVQFQARSPAGAGQVLRRVPQRQPQPGGRAIPDLRGDQGKFVVIKGGDPAPHVVAGDKQGATLQEICAACSSRRTSSCAASCGSAGSRATSACWHRASFTPTRPS